MDSKRNLFNKNKASTASWSVSEIPSPGFRHQLHPATPAVRHTWRCHLIHYLFQRRSYHSLNKHGFGGWKQVRMARRRLGFLFGGSCFDFTRCSFCPLLSIAVDFGRMCCVSDFGLVFTEEIWLLWIFLVLFINRFLGFPFTSSLLFQTDFVLDVHRILFCGTVCDCFFTEAFIMSSEL